MNLVCVLVTTRGVTRARCSGRVLATLGRLDRLKWFRKYKIAESAGEN